LTEQTGLTALRKIGMGRVSVLLQPIHEVRPHGNRVHSLECLIRGPKGSPFESPAALFEFVRAQETDVWFDRTCLKLQLESVGALPGNPRISLNAYGTTLCKDPAFASFVTDLAWGNMVAPERLTIDVSGYGPYAEDPRLSAAVKALKEQGVRVALDDSGLGDPDFRLLLDLKPDYLKVDRYLVKGLATEPAHRAILDGLVGLAQRLGFRLVAEGIETIEELAAVTEMGITLVQGFLFGQPVTPDAWRTGALPSGRGWTSTRKA